MYIKTLALSAALTASSITAHAQPPPTGWVGSLGEPSIFCDTRGQIQSIVNALEKGASEGGARFIELANQMNARNEPACAVMPVPLVEALGVISLGRITIGELTVYGWILHVRNRAGEGHYFYTESVAEALRNTI